MIVTTVMTMIAKEIVMSPMIVMIRSRLKLTIISMSENAKWQCQMANDIPRLIIIISAIFISVACVEHIRTIKCKYRN
jgi:hypothetical protein